MPPKSRTLIQTYLTRVLGRQNNSYQIPDKALH
jgi:hypothetical protein